MVYPKVIKYCKENNLSISAFEKKCGLSNGTVSGWKENGEPSLMSLQKIVSATGIKAEEWLKE